MLQTNLLIFNPDTGVLGYDNRDKYHQLWYFICSFNAKDKIIYELVIDVFLMKEGFLLNRYIVMSACIISKNLTSGFKALFYLSF